MSPFLRLCAFWFAYMGALGMFFPFYGLYLGTEAGLSAIEVGAVLSMLPLVGLLAQPFWGQAADRSGARSGVLALVAVGAGLGQLVLQQASGFVQLLAATALLALFSSAVMPMALAVSLAVLHLDGRHAFGIARAAGTVGYLALVVLFPLVLHTLAPGGLGLMFPAIALLSVIAGAIAWTLPHEGAVALRAPREGLAVLLRHGPMLRVLAFTFVAYLFLNGPIQLFPLFVRSLGGGVDDVSRMWVWMLLLEIPLVAWSGTLRVRLGARGLLAIGDQRDLEQQHPHPHPADVVDAATERAHEQREELDRAVQEQVGDEGEGEHAQHRSVPQQHREALAVLLRHGPMLRVLAFTFVAYLFLNGPIQLFPLFVRSLGGGVDDVSGISSSSIHTHIRLTSSTPPPSERTNSGKSWIGGGVDDVSRMWVWMLLLEIPLVADREQAARAGGRGRRGGAQRALPGAIGGFLERLLAAATEPATLLAAVRDVGSAVDAVASFVQEPVTVLPFHGKLGHGRRMVWRSFPFDEIESLRIAGDCTVNDAILTVLAGALRTFLDEEGVCPDDAKVRLLVPMSVRQPGADTSDLGNLITAVFPWLPVEEEDPLERLRRVREEMREIKGREMGRATAILLGALGLLPSAVEAAALRLLPDVPLVSAACTNVRGPAEPLRLLGRRIAEIHPIMNLFQGVGLTFAVASYAGRISICAATDPRLLPNGERLMQLVEESIYELRTEHWRTSAALRIAHGISERTRTASTASAAPPPPPAPPAAAVLAPSRTRAALAARGDAPRRRRPPVDVSLLTDPDLSFGPEGYVEVDVDADAVADERAAAGADHDVAGAPSRDRAHGGRVSTRRSLG